MPGVPCLYYGSEWGMAGDKKDGDPALRPALEKPQANEQTRWLSQLARAHRESPALCHGSYRPLLTQPRQLVFEREAQGQRVIVAINGDANPFTAHFDARSGLGWDLITGQQHDFGGGSLLPPYSCFYWKTES